MVAFARTLTNGKIGKLRLGRPAGREPHCSMLVINGDQDVHVPITDTHLFDGPPNTDVILIGGWHALRPQPARPAHLTATPSRGGRGHLPPTEAACAGRRTSRALSQWPLE